MWPSSRTKSSIVRMNVIPSESPTVITALTLMSFVASNVNVFDVHDISSKFSQYYEYILDLVRKKRFDEARNNLKEIRDAWVEAMNVY